VVDRWYFGKPWSTWRTAWRQKLRSPARPAPITPMLLLQRERLDDPLGQSEEMTAAAPGGRAVELVTYPRDEPRTAGRAESLAGLWRSRGMGSTAASALSSSSKRASRPPAEALIDATYTRCR